MSEKLKEITHTPRQMLRYSIFGLKQRYSIFGLNYNRILLKRNVMTGVMLYVKNERYTDSRI